MGGLGENISPYTAQLLFGNTVLAHREWFAVDVPELA